MSQETDTRTEKNSAETGEKCMSHFKGCGTTEDRRTYSERDASAKHGMSHEAQEKERDEQSKEYTEENNARADREIPHEVQNSKAQNRVWKCRTAEHKNNEPKTPTKRRVVGSTSAVVGPRTAVRGSTTADVGPRTSSTKKAPQGDDTETHPRGTEPGSVEGAASIDETALNRNTPRRDEHTPGINRGNPDKCTANPQTQSDHYQMDSKHCNGAGSKQQRSFQEKRMTSTGEGKCHRNYGQDFRRYGGMHRGRKSCASDEYFRKSIGSKTKSQPEISPEKERSTSCANGPRNQGRSGTSSKVTEDSTSSAAAYDKSGRRQRKRRRGEKIGLKTDHTSDTVIRLDDNNDINSTAERAVKSVNISSAAEAKGASRQTSSKKLRGGRREHVHTGKTKTVQKETRTKEKSEPENIIQNKTGDSSISRFPATLPKKSAAKETKLYIRVHHVFKDSHKLKKLLTSRAGVDVNPDPPKVEGKHTSCTVTCPSRNQACKLRDLLVKDKNKFPPLVNCSFSEFKKKDDQQTTLRKKRAELVEQEFDRRARTLIKSNTDKRKEFEIFLKSKNVKKSLRDVFTHEDVKAEIAAIEEKLKELEMQAIEFTTSLKTLKEKLCRAVYTRTFERNIQEIRKQFEIEASRFGKALPIYARRKDIVEMVRENQACIVLGETGSGKSTQLVQYLLESGVVHGPVPQLKTTPGDTIVCAQPRKVAALSLAKHVAREMATNIGQLVGYKVGNNMKRSQATKILFMTDHTLLNECMRDPLLLAFSCIVVDEAHERSLYTDLLLAMIKRLLPHRPDLRVIITSATIKPTVFQEFFSTCCPDCPIMYVSGRTFPVDVKWQEEQAQEIPTENYAEEAVKKVIEIHCNEPSGGILVFLTSPAETERCSKNLQERMGVRGDYRCFQLHGQQQADEQQKVFEPIETNKRKIVFATNCAETSITIDGIRYVVDTGFAKEMRYDPKRNMNSLSVSLVSKSSSDQRKGRAGRTAPGVCYRLYSESTFKDMDDDSLPEILRSHLGHALLKLAELGVGRDMYDFVQSPSEEAIDEALRSLERVGALKDGRITELGRRMAKIPLDPQLSLLVLLGRDLNLVYDSIVLAAVMSTGAGVFYRGATAEEQLRLTKKKMEKFCHKGGDNLTALSVYKEWWSFPEKEKNRWCAENCTNAKTLRGMRDAVNEVIEVLQRDDKMKIVQKFSETDTTDEVLRKLIFRCYCHNVCHFLGAQSAGYLAVGASRRVHHHPSSILADLALNPQWVVYTQLIRTSRDFITGITPVEESWLLECRSELAFDVEEVRSRTVTKVHTVTAGPHVFFTIVGPQYTRLRRLEEEACSGPVDVVLEASREAGTVTLWTTENPADEKVQQLVEDLKDIVKTSTEQLEKEDTEIPVAGHKRYGVRAVLGQGASVRELLTPDLTRKVYIYRPSPDATEETVLAKFRRYGDITFHRQSARGNNWGFLTFRTSKQALQAHATQFDDHDAGKVEHRHPPPEETEFRFRICLVWCQRPTTGVAFVSIVRPFYISCPDLYFFRVGDQEVSIEDDRYTPDNVIRGIKSFMTEEQLERGLLDILLLDGENVKNQIVRKISIVRQMPCRTVSKRDIEDEVQCILRRSNRHTHFNVEMRPTNGPDNAMFAKADVIFTDPVRGSEAAEILRPHFVVRGLRVDVSPIASVQSLIQSNVWEVCRHETMEAVQHLMSENEVVITVSEPRRKHETTVQETDADHENTTAKEAGGNVLEEVGHLDEEVQCQGDLHTDQEEVAYKHDDDRRKAIPQEVEDRLNPPNQTAESAFQRTDASYPQKVEVIPQNDKAAYSKGDQTNSEEMCSMPHDPETDSLDTDAAVENVEAQTIHDWKHEKEISSHVVITFEAETMDAALDARSYVDEVLKGEMIDGESLPNISFLMSHAGRAFLKEAERETGGTALVDSRLCTVAIHGTQHQRQQLRQRLEEFTSIERTTEEIPLKGDNMPPGVLKAFITRFGIDLEGLLIATELQHVSVNFRQHRLKVTGRPETIRAARELVTKVIEGLWDTTEHARPANPEAEECSACLTEIEPGQLSRLELCKHAYCRSCLFLQVKTSVTEGHIPVVCCHEKCDTPLAWCDFCNMARRGGVTLRDLTAASVSVFVKANPDVARFCPTADCQGVYNVSDKANVYVCPECDESTCTACHQHAHKGSSCEMVHRMKDVDQALKDWANDDKKNRKLCPNCLCGIEKIEGCNHMACHNCKVHFCWHCIKKFKSASECYGHLAQDHGGILGANNV